MGKQQHNKSTTYWWGGGRPRCWSDWIQSGDACSITTITGVSKQQSRSEKMEVPRRRCCHLSLRWAVSRGNALSILLTNPLGNKHIWCAAAFAWFEVGGASIRSLHFPAYPWDADALSAGADALIFHSSSNLGCLRSLSVAVFKKIKKIDSLCRIGCLHRRLTPANDNELALRGSTCRTNTCCLEWLSKKNHLMGGEWQIHSDLS